MYLFRMEDVLRALDALPRSTKCITLRYYTDILTAKFLNVLLEFTELEYLSISNNKITTVPPEIGQLKKLKVLRLGCNKICTLPSEIGQLTELQILSIHSNKITRLPDEICNLVNLTTLECSHNGLTSLPDNIGNLTNLKELYVVCNAITSLPVSLCKLTECDIRVYCNKIKTLPMEFKQLKNIYYGNDTPTFNDMTVSDFLSGLLEALGPISI
ncbi:leucine-rich repeat domain-containing protein [Candidatus Saccharibacteria bacterium]|nr:leucine-rich repeat domain-containing protein [Candidatus Saccharibacteria bacterium]